MTINLSCDGLCGDGEGGRREDYTWPTVHLHHSRVPRATAKAMKPEVSI